VSKYFCGSIAYVTVNNGKAVRDGGNDGPPLEQAKANSHLIAAAPALAEAIKPFVKAMKWFEDRMTADDWQEIDEATHLIGCGISVADLRRARSAYHKAMGGGNE
jgi:hypothetical protein